MCQLPPAKPSSPSPSSGIPIYYRIIFIFGLLALGAVTLVGDHNSVDTGHSSGFWGPVTSTMDWCEANYVVTPYIAEFYNTISNFGFLLFALIGIVLHPKIEFRYAVGYLSIAVIGIGSSMFHGTLLFSAQLCDELPMLYLICVLYYIIVEHESVSSTHKLMPYALAMGVTIFTIIYYIYPFPMLFQVGWGIFVMYTTYLCTTVIKNIPQKDRRAGDAGLAVLVFSIIVWVAEQALCSPTIRIFKLHAIWHLGTAYASYTSVTAMWFYRTKHILLYKRARMCYLLGFIPYVSC